jgi:hypothetical protein
MWLPQPGLSDASMDRTLHVRLSYLLMLSFVHNSCTSFVRVGQHDAMVIAEGLC